MIIFGWGSGKVKNLGAALPRTCASCGHEGFFHYFTITKWFRLYFIPVIPYSTVHFLACPICTAGTELTTSAERERVHQLVSATTALQSGTLTEEAYVAQVRAAFGAPIPSLPHPGPFGPSEMPLPPDPVPGPVPLGDTWSV